MKFHYGSSLAGLLCVLVVDAYAPRPADACGIKLTIKTQTPRKTVGRSSNPSHLLLLGTPPRRLSRELAAAGHDVEVTPNVGGAKRTDYAVVIVDQKQADEARSTFKNAVVIVRSGDVAADITSVEGQVSRRPVAGERDREVVAAAPKREVIQAGPPKTDERKVVAAMDKDKAVVETGPAPTPPPPAKEPTPPPPASQKIETSPPPAAEVRPKEPRAPKAPKSFREEIYFATNSANVTRRTAVLNRAVKWMSEASSAQIVVEGHADPTGTPAGNMALSQSRAESVRDFLVSAGIDTSRIDVISYGDTRLKYPKKDPRNRRVAIEPKP